MFNPKDVVSGDFYWFAEIGNVEVYAVADCTGHGVPGGFMSMLGIALLNEIVRKKEITQANQVLNELRKEIILALKQRGAESEQKDGMDISLLVIENDKGVCQWAGANNPLYIVTNNMQQAALLVETQTQNSSNKPSIAYYTKETETHTYTLIELNPDNMPIAI
ncbi:MAG: SpoIIE family protein phosphatase, partial [Bacteroidales bacterium]|nr:SpoIIE family protein phosphatase [Bacteroidales bacterium]